jgi:hypothetical protein
MKRTARLTEDEIKEAIKLWLYEKHDALVMTGNSISICTTQPDRPGEVGTIYANAEYTDCQPGDEST